MSTRVALTVTVLLLPVGLTTTVPIAGEIVRASAAYADTPPVDDLTDENNPPEEKNAQAQPTPPPAPAPIPAPAPAPAQLPVPGQPAAAPAAPSTPTPRQRPRIIVVPPKPADTLTSAIRHAAGRRPAAGSGSSSPPARTGKLAARPVSVSVSATSPSTIDTPALVAPVPKGGVQAGSGGTAPAHEISRLAVLLTTVALAMAAAASGLRRRRRRLASEVAYHTRSRAC
jgi:hypothetical protein